MFLNNGTYSFTMKQMNGHKNLQRPQNGLVGYWARRIVGIALLVTAVNLVFNFDRIYQKSCELPKNSPRAPRSVKNPQSDKWIVITSISKVTDDIRRLAKLEGWKIVVVGDKKSPPIWEYPNCTFLSIDSQARLEFEIHNHLPFNSYARKTMGYLFAIEHGAKFIYDTDDDNKPLSDQLDFDFRDKYSGIRVESSSEGKDAVYWNAYSHFGRPDVWPRGFPLQRIQDKRPKVLFNLYEGLKPSAIQQGLVNRDPDVDAVYRLVTYADQLPGTDPEENRIWFDPHAPSVQLGEGVYTPFNSQNTLFRYEAFWALYIPVSTSFRVCDIWRGYWALRLLPEIDESLSFHTANAIQFRNAHDYFHDYLDERALYDQANRLIDHLHGWSCKNDTFRACAIDLATMMANKGFWGHKDVAGIELWFRDLTSLGYAFPDLRKVPEKKGLRGSVRYVSSNNPLENKDFGRFQRMQNVQQFCQSKIQSGGTILMENWRKQVEKLALVVVFNRPFNGNIPFLQTLYDSWFANVLFCSTFSPDPHVINAGSAIPGFDRVIRPFSFINMTMEEMAEGASGYACLSRAMEMGLDVDGYLVIGDDVLFNFWLPFDTRELNFVSDFHCEPLENSPNPHTVDFWQGPTGRRAIETVKNDSAFLSSLTTEMRIGLLAAFADERGCNADVYYVPTHKKNDFLLLANRFLRANVFLELAVPKIFWALGWNQHDGSPYLEGTYIWKKDRANALSVFNATTHYLHPFKMSQLADEIWRKQFCQTYGTVWLQVFYNSIGDGMI